MGDANLIGIWTHDNHGNLLDSLDVRLQRFNRVLDMFGAVVKRDSASLSDGNHVQAIFVAPEYYFSGPGKTPISAADHDNTLRQLMQLSTKYPNVLIVPGTIYYSRDLSDENERQRWLRDLTKAKKTARDIKRSEIINQDIRLGSNNKIVPKLNQVHVNVMVGKPIRVLNNAYMLRNGQILFFYEKTADFLEARGATPDKQIFIPGNRSGDAQTWGSQFSLKFGLEICFDHCVGVLKRHNIPELNYHIVVSDWVNTATANFAMANKGYFIHASTNYNQSSVYYNSNGTIFNLTSDRAYWKYHGILGGDSYLDLYSIVPPPLIK
jgi:predicted amidohydrolase